MLWLCVVLCVVHTDNCPILEPTFKPLPTLPLVEVRSYLVDHRGAMPVSPECLRGFVGVLLAGVLPYALVP